MAVGTRSLRIIGAIIHKDQHRLGLDDFEEIAGAWMKGKTIVADTEFDAEYLHRWLDENGTFSLAPVRRGWRRGTHRKMLRDCFDWCLYWQRNIVESLFSAIKRLFGSSIKSKRIRTQTAERFRRLIAYNIYYRL